MCVFEPAFSLKLSQLKYKKSVSVVCFWFLALICWTDMAIKYDSVFLSWPKIGGIEFLARLKCSAN